MPAAHPKQGLLRHYHIRALSFHRKITAPFDAARPHSTLQLGGEFSMAEIHRWLCLCLPDLPARCGAPGAAVISMPRALICFPLPPSMRGRV